MPESKKSCKIPESFSAALIFPNGEVIFGKGVGTKGITIGEICFNTGMTGYQEVITDPSYAGQIINFTFPYIGNTGTNVEDVETKKPFASGVILRNDITPASNFRNDLDFSSWLEKNNITGISGVDTRYVTKKIRIDGAQNVAICRFSKAEELDIEYIIKKITEHPKMQGQELARKVTCKKNYAWSQKKWSLEHGYTLNGCGKYNVVAIDFGAKYNILRCLSEVGCNVAVVPATSSFTDIMAFNPDGVFLSNGPGDPEATIKYAKPTIKKIIDKHIPVFGICLGHQLVARALGCKTLKMQKGHRGANQPVQNMKSKKVEVTSQNHGFVVDKESLPKDIEVTHISLFDGSIEGIRSKTKPVFSVQYHPEASPGPHDSSYLFEEFVELMKERLATNIDKRK